MNLFGILDQFGYEREGKKGTGYFIFTKTFSDELPEDLPAHPMMADNRDRLPDSHNG